jgi:hypothetical protein
VGRAAGPKLPWAATVGPSHAPATRSWRAVVTPARPTRAGQARRHQGGCDRGWGAGVARWGRHPPGLRWGGPAQAHLAATVEAPAHAAAGAGLTVGRRGQTVRLDQGQPAWTARLETAVVARPGLTPKDQAGTAAHGRYHPRRALHPHPSQAVGVRQGPG